MAYFVFSDLAFGLFAVLGRQLMKLSAIDRSHDSIMLVMPIGMLAMRVRIFMLAMLYSRVAWVPVCAVIGLISRPKKGS